MNMLKEFRDFAMRGNMIDMAVGIIIGAAFGKIVTSLVNDIIMPPIGILLGNVDFSNLSFVLKAKTAEAAAVSINYGLFINNVLDFTTGAFAVFMLIRQINRLKKPQAATSRDCPFCCSSIPLKATRCPHCTAELN